MNVTQPRDLAVLWSNEKWRSRNNRNEWFVVRNRAWNLRAGMFVDKSGKHNMTKGFLLRGIVSTGVLLRLWRSGTVVVRKAHNLEVVGSNPTSAIFSWYNSVGRVLPW